MNKDTMSLLEIAIKIQSESNDKVTFLDLFNKVCKEKELTEDEAKASIAQFYTDITSCGDFVYCGDDLWDLKKNLKTKALESEFYSEHIAEEETEEEIEERKAKAKRKAAKKEAIDYEIQENEDVLETEDEGYENIQDDEDLDDNFDDDYDSYERDVDSELDEDDDFDDDNQDDFDEDKYNSIMDEFEDQYDE